MMVAKSQCPAVDKLAEYVGNDLPFGEAVALEAHFAHCRGCLERFVELGRESHQPRIPDCQVVKEIGRGRFGVVYKAWSLGDEPRMVALKVLARTGEMEESRFDREIAVLKRLDSPGIVKCIGSGVTGESMYYVMDLVDGVHLDEFMSSPDINLSTKIEVFERVCQAVGDAHAMGVIHRDLKPKNILIDRDRHPHILDFGVCSLNDTNWSSCENLTITNPGDVIGTLKYMSPEQAWGGAAGDAHEPSDIWSLGIMLYEILTDGGYPYSLEGEGGKPVHEALLDRIRHELPRLPRLEALPRGRDLEVLLERTLAWDPDHRIQSASQLGEDLKRYLKGRRIQTKPLWIPYRLKRLAIGAAARSRWRFSAAFIAGVGLTLWVTAFFFGVGWGKSGTSFQGQGDAASPASPVAARDAIVVVGVSEATVEAVTNFSSRHGIDGVGRHHSSWRGVHGYLMERLVSAGPRVVTWDYVFRTDKPSDESLSSGISALESAGIPVVLAVRKYYEGNVPELCTRLLEPRSHRLRHGAISARDQVKRPGEFVMVIRRPGEAPVPSLALATVAAALHPEAHLELEWRGERSRTVELLYERSPGAFLRTRDEIELSRFIGATRGHDNVRTGDDVGSTVVALADPSYWWGRTVPYETLLTCSDEELRTHVADKILIFGDLRPRSLGFLGDRHPVKYGRSIVSDVPGCFLQADAIAGVLSQRYVEMAWPLSTLSLVMISIFAAIGCAVPVGMAAKQWLSSRAPRTLLYAALGIISAFCFVMMVATRDYLVVHLSMAGVALFAPMIGSFWVEFARNRHRIPTRRARAIDLMGTTVIGTVTLPAKRSRSPIEAR